MIATPNILLFKNTIKLVFLL